MARLNNIAFKSGLQVQQVQGVDVDRLLRHGVPIHASTIHGSLTFTRPVQVSEASIQNFLLRLGPEGRVSLSDTRPCQTPEEHRLLRQK